MAGPEKYTITRKLDAGGMAEVYEGVAEGIRGFRKKVAIKRVLPHLTENRKFIAMFLDEARLSLYLSHANIVQVFDIGQAGGTYFIVMEYINGVNLKKLMSLLKERGQRLPVAQSIYIAMEICRGLSYAHGLSDPDGSPLHIVHRDVSPVNILLSRQGEVKIVDFGLAKATSQLEDTSPGVVKGKYAYLSPESVSGNPVDHRMDIFCTGILLWEMLTGQRLFLGNSDRETVLNVRKARVPSASAINPEVSPMLEHILVRTLAADPAKRFQTCDALGEALAQCLFAEQLKVTGFDLRRTLSQVLSEEAERPSNSIIDNMIQEEISVFASLDGGHQGDDGPEDMAGNRPLQITGFETVSATGTDTGVRADSSEPTSLEQLLEGGTTLTATDSSQMTEEDRIRENRLNFLTGLVVTLAVLTVGAALVWLLIGNR